MNCANSISGHSSAQLFGELCSQQVEVDSVVLTSPSFTSSSVVTAFQWNGIWRDVERHSTSLTVQVGTSFKGTSLLVSTFASLQAAVKIANSKIELSTSPFLFPSTLAVSASGVEINGLNTVYISRVSGQFPLFHISAPSFKLSNAVVAGPISTITSPGSFLVDNVVSQSGVCGLGWTYFGSACYLLLREKVTWAGAGLSCSRQGGLLASVRDSATNLFLTQTLVCEGNVGGCDSVWIGGKLSSEGIPSWLDNSDATTFLWPLSGTLIESQGCVYIDTESGGLWNVDNCLVTRLGVCRKPMPGGVALGAALFQKVNLVQTQNFTVQVESFHEVLSLRNQKTVVFHFAQWKSFRVPLLSPQAVTVLVFGSGFDTIQQEAYQVACDTHLSNTVFAHGVTSSQLIFSCGSQLPKYLQLINVGTSSGAVVDLVQIVVNDVLVFEINSNQFLDCPLAGLNSNSLFQLNANHGLLFDHELAFDLAGQGCAMLSLWNHPLRQPQFGVFVQTWNPTLAKELNLFFDNTYLGGEDEMVSIPLLEPQLFKSIAIKVISGKQACVVSVALFRHGILAMNVTSESAFFTQKDRGICGRVYSTPQRCLQFGSGDFLDSAEFRFVADAQDDENIQIANAIVSSTGQSSVLSCSLSTQVTSIDELQTALAYFFSPQFPYSSFNLTVPELVDSRAIEADLKSTTSFLGVRELILWNDLNNPPLLLTGSFIVASNLRLDFENVALNFTSRKPVLQTVDCALKCVSCVIHQIPSEHFWVLDVSTSTIDMGAISRAAFGSRIGFSQLSATATLPSSPWFTFLGAEPGAVKVQSLRIPFGAIALISSSNLPSLTFLDAMRTFLFSSSCDKQTGLFLEDFTEVQSFESCDIACNANAQCNAYAVVINEVTKQTECHLCLHSDCLRNCDTPGTFFYAVEQSKSVSVSACFVDDVHPFQEFSPTTFPECQTLCSYYTDCLSFVFTDQICQLFYTNEIGLCDAQTLPMTLHLPTSIVQDDDDDAEEFSDYLLVAVGKLRTGLQPIEVPLSTSKGKHDCYTLCEAFQHCIAFSSLNSNCALYQKSSTVLPEVNYVYAKRSLNYPLVSFSPLSSMNLEMIRNISSLALKTLFSFRRNLCESACKELYSCVLYAYVGRSTLGVFNCFLFDQVEAQQVVNLNKFSSVGAIQFFLGVLVTDFVPLTVPAESCQNRALVSQAQVQTLDACKGLCWTFQHCNSIRFNDSSLTCEFSQEFGVPCAFNTTWELIAGSNTTSTSSVYSLEKDSYIQSLDQIYALRRVPSTCLLSTPVWHSSDFALNLTSVPSCRAGCNIHPQCSAFSFFHDKCLFFQQAEVEPCVDLIDMDLYISITNIRRQLYQQLPPNLCFIHNNFLPFDETNVKDVLDCRQACFNHVQCRAFSFSNSTCFLRSEVEFDFGNENCSPEFAFVETFEPHYRVVSDAHNALSFGSVPLVPVLSHTSKRACETLCEVFQACVGIAVSATADANEFSSEGMNCVLLQRPQSTNMVTFTLENEVDPLVIFNRLEAFAFTHVSKPRFCPKESTRLLSIENMLRVEDCETLCDSFYLCDQFRFIPSTLTCDFFPRQSWPSLSFVEEDCNFDDFSTYMVSFQRFAEPVQLFAHVESQFFTSSMPYRVVSQVYTAAACSLACVNATSSDCSFAEYSASVASCALFDKSAFLQHGSSPNANPAFLIPFMDTNGFVAQADNKDTWQFRRPQVAIASKDTAECAALCDNWSECEAFFIDDYGTCQMGAKKISQAQSSPFRTVDAFVKNQGPFTRVGDSNWYGDHCLPTDKAQAVIEHVSLEGCKQLCSVDVDCAALKWDLNTCWMFSFGLSGFTDCPYKSQFSIPYNPSPSFELVSLQRVVDPFSQFRLFEFQNLCLSGGVVQVEIDSALSCRARCLASSECTLFQFTQTTCTLFTATQFDEFSTCEATRSGIKLQLTLYQGTPGISQTTSILESLENKELPECMAICDLLNFCTGIVFDAPNRICYTKGRFSNVESFFNSTTQTYYSNTRGFVTQKTTFGPPQRVLLTISLPSSIICEQACTKLKACKAFVFSSNTCTLSSWERTSPGILRNMGEPVCLGLFNPRPVGNGAACAQVQFEFNSGSGSLGRIQYVRPSGKLPCAKRETWFGLSFSGITNQNVNVQPFTSCDFSSGVLQTLQNCKIGINAAYGSNGATNPTFLKVSTTGGVLSFADMASACWDASQGKWTSLCEWQISFLGSGNFQISSRAVTCHLGTNTNGFFCSSTVQTVSAFFSTLSATLNPRHVMSSCEPTNQDIIQVPVTWFGNDMDNLASTSSTSRLQLKYTGWRQTQSTFLATSDKWWLKYDDVTFSRTVNVRVSSVALNQATAVTNTGFLFYSWLYGEEGRLVRSMRSKVLVLRTLVTRTQRVFDFAQGLLDEATGIVNSVQRPVDLMADVATDVSNSLKILSLACSIGTRLPYIKYVARPIKTVLGEGSSVVQRGSAAVRSGSRKFNILVAPLEELTAKVAQAKSLIVKPLDLLDGAAELLTQVSYCASRSGLSSRVKNIAAIVNRVIGKINILEEASQFMQQALGQVSSFKRTVVDFFVKPLQILERAFEPISKILSYFSFLKVVFTLRVCFQVPVLGSMCLPTLQDIATFVEHVFDLINSIPFVGWAIQMFDNLVNTVIRGIFGEIHLPLPNFDLNLNFLDSLKESLTIAMSGITAKIDVFNSLENLVPFQTDLHRELLSKLPNQLANLECNDLPCILSATGVSVQFVHDAINSVSNAVITGETAITQFFTKLSNEMSQLVSNFGSFFLQLDSFLLDIVMGMSCKETKTLDFPLDAILEPFGELKQELCENDTTCVISVNVCSNIEMGRGKLNRVASLAQGNAFATQFFSLFDFALKKDPFTKCFSHGETWRQMLAAIGIQFDFSQMEEVFGQLFSLPFGFIHPGNTGFVVKLGLSEMLMPQSYKAWKAKASNFFDPRSSSFVKKSGPRMVSIKHPKFFWKLMARLYLHNMNLVIGCEHGQNSLRLQFSMIPAEFHVSVGRHLTKADVNSVFLNSVIEMSTAKCQCDLLDQLFADKQLIDNGKLVALSALCRPHPQPFACLSQVKVQTIWEDIRSECQHIFQPNDPLELRIRIFQRHKDDFVKAMALVTSDDTVEAISDMITLASSAASFTDSQGELLTSTIRKLTEECDGDSYDPESLEVLFARDPYIYDFVHKQKSNVKKLVFLLETKLGDFGGKQVAKVLTKASDKAFEMYTTVAGLDLAKKVGVGLALSIVCPMLFMTHLMVSAQPGYSFASGTSYELGWKDFGVWQLKNDVILKENSSPPFMKSPSLMGLFTIQSFIKAFVFKNLIDSFPAESSEFGTRIVRGQGVNLRVRNLLGATIDFGGPPIRSSSISLPRTNPDGSQTSFKFNSFATSQELCAGIFCVGLGQWGQTRRYLDLSMESGFVRDQTWIGNPFTVFFPVSTPNPESAVHLCEVTIVSTRLKDQAGDGSMDPWIFLEDWRVPARLSAVARAQAAFQTPPKLFASTYDNVQSTCVNIDNPPSYFISSPGFNLRVVLPAYDELNKLRFSFKSGKQISSNATREYSFKLQGTGFATGWAWSSGNFMVGVQSRHFWSILCSRTGLDAFGCALDGTLSLVSSSSAFSLSHVEIVCAGGASVVWIAEQSESALNTQIGGGGNSVVNVGSFWNGAFLPCEVVRIDLVNVVVISPITMSLKSSGNGEGDMNPMTLNSAPAWSCEVSDQAIVCT